jgi:hypothetical protein
MWFSASYNAIYFVFSLAIRRSALLFLCFANIFRSVICLLYTYVQFLKFYYNQNFQQFIVCAFGLG